MVRVPTRYFPKHLSKKDKRTIREELKRSRRRYKHGNYHRRKSVKSFKGKPSKWTHKIREVYSIPADAKLSLSMLEKKTKCNKKGMVKIISKGKGAYFSSGSRPNQTPTSWGVARLYSALSGGPSSIVDIGVLQDHCAKNSKAVKLAKKRRKKKKPHQRTSFL